MPNSQKEIGRNRAPRVHIVYDVHLSPTDTKKVELPFVIGAIGDYTGNPAEPLPSIDQREFLEVDVDNFDARMKAMKPRVAFQVPNTLTGEGQLPIELTFEKIEDFSPAAIARKVAPLRRLLEARTQLSNFLTSMDGRSDVEELVSQLIADPALMRAIVAAPSPVEAPQS